MELLHLWEVGHRSTSWKTVALYDGFPIRVHSSQGQEKWSRLAR